MRHRSPLLVGALAAAAIALAIAAAAGPVTSALPPGPEATMDGWLAAMSGTETNRGWSYLSPVTQQEAYEGDVAAYLKDVSAVRWDDVVWSPATGFADEGFFSVHVDLLSDPRTIPSFLLERELVSPRCSDRAGMGIGAYMKLEWFGRPYPEAGGRTGSGQRCADSFTQLDGPLSPPADLVGAAFASGGQSIRVGVKDPTGVVTNIGPGRENPTVRGEVTVGDVEPGQIGVAWIGTVCDEPARIELRPGAHGLDLVLFTTTKTAPCGDRGLTYELMMTVSGSISARDISARRQNLELE